MFQRILVAVEPRSERTVASQAIELARLHHATLLFVHVSSAFDETYAGSFYPGVDSLYPTLHNPMLQSYVESWTTVEARNRDWLKSLVNAATQAGVSATYQQGLGEPGSMLCQIAADESVDLMLVGRRGRSGLSEMLLGSVSNYVMHHAPCSVLTVQGANVEALVAGKPLQTAVH